MRPSFFRFRRVLRFAVLSMGPTFAMLTSFFARFQEKLIFPGSLYRGSAFTKFSPSPPAELVCLPSPAGTLIGHWIPAAPSSCHPLTVLYFYGNGSCLATTQDDAGVWHSLGVNLMRVDYAGYGMSEGRASEAGTVAACSTALTYLREVQKIPSERMVFAGSSLGGAVAVRGAAENDCAGLITLCTFTSMGEMAARKFPLLPFKEPLLRHPFASRFWLKKGTCPLLLIHGDRDTLVPFSMRDELAKTAREREGRRVETVTIEGGGHDGLLHRKETVRAVRRFLESLQ